MSDFIAGFRYGFSGFGLILRPGIRLYVVVPLLINMLLFTGAFIWGAEALNDLIHWIAGQWSWAEWVAWLLWPIFVVISLTIMFFAFSIFANLLGAPFNGFLSAAVERTLSGVDTIEDEAGRGLLAELVEAVRAEGEKFLYFLLRALPLLLLFLVPLVQAIAPVVWFLFGAWMLSLEYLDYPFGNRGLTFPQVRAAVSGRRGLALGFGVAVFLLTMMPIANFVAMPVAVAGATRMWLEKMRAPGPVPA